MYEGLAASVDKGEDCREDEQTVHSTMAQGAIQVGKEREVRIVR